MDIPFGPYTEGIDHVSSDGDLKKGAVKDAVNVEFGREGNVARRAGYTQRIASTSVHSLWTSSDGRSFGVQDGEFSTFTWDGSTLSRETISDETFGGPLSYDEVNDLVVFGSADGLWQVDQDNAVVRVGLPRHAAPVVAPVSGGGLNAGRYAVAIAEMRGNEEGPLSPAAFVDVEEGGGFSIEARHAVLRVYRSEANGEVLYRAADLPNTPTDLYNIGIGPLGRQADTQYLDRMVGGQIVRHWRGHIVVARGRVLAWSEPMRFGVFDPRHNFIQFPKTITLCEPVEGGIWVGTADGVFWLGGSSPKELTLKRTSGGTPVAYTGARIPGKLLVGDQAGDRKVAVWLADNGVCLGSPEGQLIETQAKRIRIPSSQLGGIGASVVHDSRFIATIN